jgi:methylated-DNA-[protein]-cysteine S-methyltransferase
MYYTHHRSPVGQLTIVASDAGLHSLALPNQPSARACPEPGWHRDRHAAREVLRQLDSYFAGELQQFELPLSPRGTPFQRGVWDRLLTIGYGQTCSYGTIASALGKPNAARAVGAANGSNPIAIIVPCHRVIGGDGRLTGYAGGLDAKRWLLDHEAIHLTTTDYGSKIALQASSLV